MSKEEFYRILGSFSLLDQQVAEAVTVSRPTVSRWREGRNAPAPVLRKAIIEELRELEEKASG